MSESSEISLLEISEIDMRLSLYLKIGSFDGKVKWSR